MVRIGCSCQFDITVTGVTGYFRPEKLPFKDQSGKTITNNGDWLVSRNQQRNWETLLQIISLRTQVFDLTTPVQDGGWWRFEYSVDSVSVYSDSPVCDFNILKKDAHNVPILLLKKDSVTAEMIDVYSSSPNLYFELIG